MTKKVSKIAVLSPSLVLTSAYAITGVLPQLKAGLGLSQGQTEYLVTIPSIVVLAMVLISPWLQRWLRLTNKQMIMAGLVIIGLAGMTPLAFHQYRQLVWARIFLGLGIGLYNAQAISIIADWYQGKTLSFMLGWHAAFEELGQALSVSLASLLMLAGGWQMSFAAYALAWLVLFLFVMKVPNRTPKPAEPDQTRARASQGKLHPRVYALMAMAFLILIAYVAMENRFASLAVYLKGPDYRGSGKFLSFMLLGSTIGGLTYGQLHDWLGERIVYLALGLLALANLLFYFGASRFSLIALAVMMQGFPLQLISPWMFNQLGKVVSPQKRSIANSIVLVGFNLGAFISPSVSMMFNRLNGGKAAGLGLAAPFLTYGIMLLLMMIAFAMFRRWKREHYRSHL